MFSLMVSVGNYLAAQSEHILFVGNVIILSLNFSFWNSFDFVTVHASTITTRLQRWIKLTLSIFDDDNNNNIKWTI